VFSSVFNYAGHRVDFTPFYLIYQA